MLSGDNTDRWLEVELLPVVLVLAAVLALLMLAVVSVQGLLLVLVLVLMLVMVSVSRTVLNSYKSVVLLTATLGGSCTSES